MSDSPDSTSNLPLTTQRQSVEDARNKLIAFLEEDVIFYSRASRDTDLRESHRIEAEQKLAYRRRQLAALKDGTWDGFSPLIIAKH